jgi:hypothetical protein
VQLWALKDALLADKIEDDLLYEIDELDGIPIKGRHLKNQDFLLQVVERHIRWCVEHPGEFARYYPKWYRWLVWQFDPEAPAYTINPKFRGVREIAEELGLPVGDDVFYRSRVCSDSSFPSISGFAPEPAGQYTIEVLGVETRPLPLKISLVTGSQVPNYFDYSCPPLCLHEIDSSITVVWRLRIFSCPVDHFEFSPATPLVPSNPKVLHFERRWHPDKGIEECFKNVEQVRTHTPTQFDRFKADVFALLREHRQGRPRNSGELSREEFIRIYEGVLERHGGKEPPFATLLKEFKISASTFYKYAKLYDLLRRR